MAALSSYVFHLLHRNPFSLHFQPEMPDFKIFSFAFLIFCVALSLLLSLFFISLSVSKKLSKTEQQQQEERTQNPKSYDSTIVKHSPSQGVGEVEVRKPNETNPTHLTLSLLLAVLPSDSARWASLFGGKSCECDDPNSTSSSGGGREDSGEEQREKKKKKRKAKKKKVNSIGEDSAEHNKSGERADTSSNVRLRKESVCLYPFTSSSSAMQRKIKQQYDELVKCHESKKLTLAQVVKFANSLVDARKELQHKADAIQRKFVITKALLFKADRSSFDRLRQQIYKLELEQKRLEDDAAVYNWLQQQLKLSPAYKKMLEIEVCMEKAKTYKLGENIEDEFADISFEELLAQEKKDSFWQKNGKSRICSSS